jgi:soluble lytic murein transglycosylase-like protein
MLVLLMTTGLLVSLPNRAEANVEECGLALLNDVGRNHAESQQLPELYRKHSVNRDEEFMRMLFSVIYVESKFNKRALSNRQAYGLMQMTVDAVTSSVQHCGLRPLLSMDKMFDSATNIKYGSCYLRHMLNEADGDWTRALILYNGGYRQLTKYDKGDTIVSETSNYVLQVYRALHICRQAETK